jgi:DNA polymerase I-like protein with 3'-5' exonuclease and polymerase domains
MIIFDVESNGLLEEATKIHCLSFVDTKADAPYDNTVITYHDYDDMRELLRREKHLLGHNIIRYDIPLLEKILDIKIDARLYDTLPMSWVMNPSRGKHGLDSFFPDFGIEKPKIDDWENLSRDDYAHRCEADVQITYALWDNLLKRFLTLYKDKKDLDKFFRYLEFKMDCAKEAEQHGWKVNVEFAKECAAKLTELQDQKVAELSEVMPMRKLYRVQSKPKVCFKKDGSVSSHGSRWFSLLDEHGLPDNYEGDVTVVRGVEEANPNSTEQVKEWLTSLGWKPCTFKYTKNKETGEEKAVEQIRSNGELTESVKLLIKDSPAVEVLDGLTILQHRLGIFNGFIECERDGYLKAEIDGLTNTLRFKHRKPLVNLPSVEKPWGKEIRSCLTAPEGFLLCGADMTSLEDTTKRHYMKPYDPRYVEEMSRDGFDPHLDLAKHAKIITQSDIDKHQRGEVDLKALRKDFKVVNYSATYGVGAEKLARETGMSVKKARALLKAYWKRNWSVKAFSDEQTIRKIGEEMWIQNPVSKFWHSLRYEKDAFSTINQSTGSYCFDKWVAFYRIKRSNIVGQFHDESINVIKKGEENVHTSTLQWAIKELNKQLKLNVELGIDVQYGNTYAEVH